MAKAHAPDTSHYFIPHGSPWPIRASIALFVMMLGAVGYLNDWAGAWVFLPGAVLLAYMFFGWFSTVIDENQHGVYNLQVDRSFRMAMMWFIFSEVMFFAAFFGALFYSRVLSVPWLGGQGVKVFTNFILWPQFEGAWPTNGPAHVGGRPDSTFGIIPAFGVPALNTAILLTSGLTVTIAHHALRGAQRVKLAMFLALTFLLGFTFVGLQAHEYGEAYQNLGLRLSTGIYGSTFFMLTGFHGLHVTIGAIMLTVIWLRVLRGHFTATRHFAFEAVAWYWHFVDVVWLGLFIFVYWL
ncbi:MAG: cytochrome c oxidase subunit 3 [Bacillati bacterium ANGP1]|uniref:cytochrome-c oxidase n=1 Tax=Candidatus Segetimicrobium genomatis TaxID=2569760 RepID=A0A537K8L2_9BACT|nr:MAG: cytochrome c oxidase subunit 3 [Gammaproteobacteria bacterium]TMI92113.1 MAG: cytochrome c oxidase subunit 3 [Terrabacteria group bacterium ANGP1]